MICIEDRFRLLGRNEVVALNLVLIKADFCNLYNVKYMSTQHD